MTVLVGIRLNRNWNYYWNLLEKVEYCSGSWIK